MNRNEFRGLAVVCLALLVSACSGGLEADKRAATKRIEAYISTQPKLDPDTAGEMRAYRLRNGMTEAEVRATNRYRRSLAVAQPSARAVATPMSAIAVAPDA